MAECAEVLRRAAGPLDEDLLRALFADSRPDLAMLAPEVREVLLDLQFRAQRSQYAASHPLARHEILLVDGVAVGRLLVEDAHDVVRIVDVTVSRDHRCRGIGSAVLRQLSHEADETGRAVRLSVWSENRGARRLYESLGFVTVADAGARTGGYLEMQRAHVQEGVAP
ncbi:GNAT family N-acetyltransferase [Nocardioides sp.]|jgi:ribosomal protein S18 acetylase RimI-like enzyme|uniref:GNAT family N-acetyltransferase n=1 Tax=Nocardioides sp. TaxID=35761 RepID=UPI0031FEFCA4|nr:Acetyltransferase, family [Nocardioides sp.]